MFCDKYNDYRDFEVPDKVPKTRYIWVLKKDISRYLRADYHFYLPIRKLKHDTMDFMILMER